MHESTVSRATNGKYVQTPRGLFELKYFFTADFPLIKEKYLLPALKQLLKIL